MITEVTDAIRRVLAGDMDAYDTIYKASNGPLRAFIAWKYRHYGKDFLEDVASRTHIMILSKLAKFDPKRAGFMTWVRLLARNAARAEIRFRYGRRYLPFVPMESYEYPATSRGPADEYEFARTRRILQEALDLLPDEHRDVIEQCCEQGKTTQEAADAMGVSQPTVSRKRSRALKALRKRILDRDAQYVERDMTRILRPVYIDDTGYDDDWTATVGASIPDDPEPLTDRAAKDEREEGDSG